MNVPPPPPPSGDPSRPAPPPPAPPLRKAAPLPGPRIMAPRSGSPPAPGSLIRSLIATRSWTGLCAIAGILFGIFAIFRASQRWKALNLMQQWSGETSSSAALLLGRIEVIFLYAVGAGCLYVAPKLFRYAGAITRLRQGGRMQELENALRHQKTVWVVLGTLGAMWLALFAAQIASSIAASSGGDGVQEIDLDN